MSITANGSSSIPSVSLTVPSTYTTLTNTTAVDQSTTGSSAFAADLDYAGQTHLLANNEPDPNVAFLTQLQSMLAGAGFTLSMNPMDLAVTVQNAGTQWSVTDRSSGITLTIAKQSNGTFSVLEPEISATVIGASLAVGVASTAGVGLAIGAAIAVNLIGYNEDGSENAAQVQAQILNASVNAGTGALDLTATASQSIYACVGAFAVAVGGASTGGGAGAGAGANSLNEMAMQITAAINGDGSSGIQAGSITLQATDSSSITAVTGEATVAFSWGSTAAVSVAIGAAIANNDIGNTVSAYVQNASNVTTTGALSATALEAASIDATTYAASVAVAISYIGIAAAVGVLTATNNLTNTVAAYVSGSMPVQAGAVTLSAGDQAAIQAYSLSLALAGGVFGIAVGVGVGNNTINDNVSAYVQSSTIVATGAINVTATSNQAITTTSTVAAISAAAGAAVAVFSSTTTIEGTTQAYLNNAALTATGQAIKVTATSTEDLTPTTTGGAASFVGVAAMSSTANVQGSTLAQLMGVTTVSAGSLTVTANDSSTSAPVTNVGGVGGLTVNNASSSTTLSRQTEASIPTGANITMLAGSLTLAAVSTDSASTSSEAVGVGVLVAVTNIGITSTINGTTSSTVAAGAQVQAPSGNVAITASSVNNASATTENIGVSPLDIQVSSPTANDDSTTKAIMLGNLSANGLLIESTSDDQAVANGGGGGGGLIQVGVVNVTAKADPTVKANIGGTVQVTNNIGVHAIDTADADTTDTSGSGGVLNISAQNAVDTLNPNVSSDVATSANLNAGGTITVDAKHGLSTVLSGVTSTGSSTITGLSSTSNLSDGMAVTGTDLTGGPYVIQSIPSATSITLNTGAGITGDSNASLTFAPPLLSDGTFNAATAVNTTNNTITLNGNSGLQTGDTVTYLPGSGNTAIGNLGSSRQYSVIADPTTPKVLSLGATFGTPTVLTGVTTANNADITGLASTSSLTVGATVTGKDLTGASYTIQNILSPTSIELSTATGVNADPNASLTFSTPAVNTATGTIHFAAPDNFQTGDQVVYEAPAGTTVSLTGVTAAGNSTITGLSSTSNLSVGMTVTGTNLTGGSYVIASILSPTSISLNTGTGVTANASASLSFSTPAMGTPVGGLVNGQTYVVNVIDPQTITLYPANTPLPKAQSFTGAAVNENSSTNTITILKNGFTKGEAVTYQAPAASSFDLSNVSNNTIDAGASSGLIAGDKVIYTTPSQTFTSANVNGSQISIPGHGFTTGETLYYQPGSPPLQNYNTAQNLTAGTYYAIRVDANTLELAATLADATAAVPHPLVFTAMQTTASGTLTAAPLAGLTSGTKYVVLVPDPTHPNLIQLATMAQPTTPIALNPSTAAADASVSNTLRNVANQPIGGLSDGATYYVTGISGNSFQLATDSAGTDTVTLTSSAALTGTSTLQPTGIIPTSQGTGTQTLVLKLTSVGSGTQTLEGVGGAASLAHTPGSGVSIASASGGGGGLLQIASVSASVTGTPSVMTTVEKSVVMNAANIDVESDAMGDVASVATGGGGALLLQVGVSNSTVTVTPKSTLNIDANDVLDATGNITVKSTTSSNSQTQATSDGGSGLFAFGAANVSSTVSHSSTVEIGDSAKLDAQGTLDVESFSNDTASATSSVAEGSLLVSTATNTTTLNVGSSSTPTPATTKTTIDSGALLQGNTVTVGATVTGLNLTDTASESSGGVGAGATAKSEMAINDNTQVHLESNSTVSGTTVNIRALNENVSLTSQATANIYTLIGYPESDADITYQSTATVNADTGSHVSGGKSSINATDQTPSSQQTSNAYYDGARNSGTSNTGGSINPQPILNWNGDAAVQSDPVLVVNANGAITQAVGVSVNGGQTTGNITGSTISVDPISNSDNLSNAITFSAPGGVIEGSGTLSAAAAFDTITITNYSNKILVINGIQTANPNVHPTLDLNAASTSGFTAAVDNTVPPTNVTIDDEGTGNVVLNAPSQVPGAPSGSSLGYSIYNPVGTTTIIARHGSVLNGSTSTYVPTIWTRTLDVTAGGSVGTSTNRLSVDLVLPYAQTGLNVTAGADVFLDLTGVLREALPPGTVPTFLGGVIQTPGQINLLLEPIVEDDAPLPAVSVYAFRVDNIGSSTGSPTKINSTAPPDPHAFPDYTQSTLVSVTFQFDKLVAGGNITINATPPPQGSTATVGVTSQTSTPGQIYAHVSGDITLDETTGDFNVALVKSDTGDVALTAENGSIVAAVNTPPLAGTPPWVYGNNVTFTALDGSIGSGSLLSELLQIVSTGVLTALAKLGVYLSATSGNLNVDKVLSQVSDVVLIAQQGSILNAAVVGMQFKHPLTTNIQGRNIDLQATSTGGTIGSSTYPIEILGAGTGQHPDDGFQIQTFAPGTGSLVAQAGGDIDLMETSGALNVLGVNSTSGNVSLLVHDSVLTGQDLNLLPSGSPLVPSIAITVGQIAAPKGNVSVYAGDNVTVPAGTSITAGTSVLVEGDYSQNNGFPSYDNNYSSSAFAPNATGAIIAITGNLQAPTVAVNSDSQTNVDYIELLNPAGINATPAGATTAYVTTITGGGGDDRIFIDAVAGPTTVAEAPGAERIYVAQNASRALFTVGSSSPSSQVLELTGTPTAGEVYQLTLNGVTAANATTFNASSVTGNLAANTINVGSGSGLSAGSQVTYTTPSQTFTPAAVNSNNTLITLVGHGFTTGEKLLYQATTPLPLAGGGTLTPGAPYYAIRVDPNTFELADSNADALADNPLQFASSVTGSNDQTLTPVGGLSQTFTPADVKGANTTVTLAGHGFATGEALLYQATTLLPLANGGTLQRDTIYYAIQVDANSFELADSNADALAGNTLQFASPATVSSVQTLTAVPVGGLTSGTTYSVLVPDPTNHPNLIQLENPATGSAIVLTPSTAAGDRGVPITLSRVSEDPAVTKVGVSAVTGALTANTINVGPSSGLTSGEEVTYTTPTQTFTPAAVNSDNTTITLNGHGFTTGEALLYQATTPLPLASGGTLQPGTTYYAIRLTSDTFKLADSYNDAVAGTALQFASPATGSNDQTLSAAPVGGLVSGTTYTVIVPDSSKPNLIQLANIGTPTTPIQLTPSVTTADLSVTSSLSQVSHYSYTVPSSGATLQNVATALAALINSPSSPIPGYNASVSAGGMELIISRTDGQAFTATPTLTGSAGTFITVGTANGGYYDDTDINPLDVLAGSLTNMGDLTIDTGPGGNGGTTDEIYISAAGSTAAMTGTMTSNDSTKINTITGLGVRNANGISINTTGGGALLTLLLGNGSNTLNVTGVSDNVAAFVYGGTGANTFNVGDATTHDLSQIDGILGVFGTGGANTLNVYGNAAPGGQFLNQLTAIGISGMGMGYNTTLRSVHNDVFGAGFNSTTSNEDPAVVYYGQRGIQDGIETITSSVQQVNVYLGTGTQTFNVDSTYGSGTTNIYAGSGSDSITVGSTVSGLNPAQTDDVAYVAGPLNIQGAAGGADTVLVDASGGDFSAASRIGQLQNNTVTGLGMAGSIAMTQVANVQLDLGPFGNTFYVPSTVAGTNTAIYAGAGLNTVYLGTAEGSAGTGSLAALQGNLTLYGQAENGQVALAGNEIAFDDQSDATAQTWMVSDNTNTTPDTTTVTIPSTLTSTGTPVSVSFQRFETVVLNGGQGNNTFNVYGTQREQGSNGGHSSTFTINTGDGNDTVNVGTQQGSLGSFLIDTTAAGGGVPVMVNGQGGNDIVQFMDTASPTNTNLAFVTQQFTDIFPNAATGPTVTATQLTEPAGANEQYQLSDTATGGTFNLTISGVPGQQPIVVQSIPYNVSAATLALMIEDAATVTDASGNQTQEVTVNVTENTSTRWTIEFTSPSSGITLTADGSNLTSPEQLAPAMGQPSHSGTNYSPPAQTYLAQFSQIFGAPADATPYNTVALSEQATVTVSPTTSSAQFLVDENSAEPSADPTGGTFDLTISGVPNQAPFDVQGIPYNASADTLRSLIEQATFVPGANNVMTHEVTATVSGDSTTGWTIQFTNPSTNNPLSVTLTADASGLTTPSAALNVHTRGIQTVAASLGSGNNVVQLNGPTAYNIMVNGDQTGTSSLTFNVSPSFDNSNGNGGFYSAVLNGGGGANTLFANYANGVPDALASLTFNGGTSATTITTNGMTAAGSATVTGLASTTGLAVGMSVTGPDLTEGPYTITAINSATSAITLNTGLGVKADSNAALNISYTNTLRIQGDGVANGTYTPSATQDDAGVVNVNNDLFTFGNTQTLIVHGLGQLMDVTPSNASADLNVNSQTVASLNLPNLILHQVTVQGVVTWTQRQSSAPPPAQQALHLGKVSALSPDGTILVVGADLKDPSSDINALDSYGAVFVYTWDSTTSSWVQQAQLEPNDLAGGGGGGFGDAVSISADDSTIVVGAPGDVDGGTNAGAVYVFQHDFSGAWVQVGEKLKASDMAANAGFGTSVAVASGSGFGYSLFVGAPGSGEVYVFSSRNGSAWTQQSVFNAPASGDQFGDAVAVSGDVAVVGADGSSSKGAAYVFACINGVWSQVATPLAPSDSRAGDEFGAAVAIDGDLVVVGDPNGNAPVPTEDQTTSPGFVNAGEAFVFNLSTQTPVLEARLTETDGLPYANAEAVGQQLVNEVVGDQFGAAVAIAGNDTDGYYVVVGAPGYQSGTGAAYAFYRLSDQGSGNGPSWTRSSGSSGSGQLTPAAPQHSQQQGNVTLLAGLFGSSVVVGGVSSSGALLVVGTEGYNQTSSSNGITFITAANAGAVRTYTTDGTLPSTTDPHLDAEILDGSTGQTNFGQNTVYDPTTRMLFVAAPVTSGGGAVDVYVNEGLYWSFVQTLTAPTQTNPAPSLPTGESYSSVQFGYALAADGNTLVIGAPAPSTDTGYDGLVLIYTLSGGTWTWQQTITGGSYDFGYSVAVDGSNLVVGSPRETVSYSSEDQGDTTSGDETTGLPANSPYRLDLTDSGAAYTYHLSGSTWALSNLLMPDDNNLPSDTSTPQDDTSLDGNVTFNYDSPPANQEPAGVGSQSAGSGLIGQFNYYNFTDVQLAPRTELDLTSIPVGTFPNYETYKVQLFNDSYTDFLTYQFNNSNPDGTDLTVYNATGSGGVNAYTVKTFPPSAADATYDGLNNAGWGKSVAIVGNTVAVGAPGAGGVALYNLGGFTSFTWTAYSPETSSNGMAPLTPSSYGGVVVGADVALQGTETALNQGDGELFTAGNSAVDAYSITNFKLSSTSTYVAEAGFAGSIGLANNEVLIGDQFATVNGNPNVGDAVVYNAALSATGATLTPFNFSTQSHAEGDETAAVGFGIGGSPISEGFYVVGGQNTNTVNSDSAGLLYDFRQRGPAWTPLVSTATGSSLLTPTENPQAQAGSSVAISGDTFVAGAPEYNNSGAVFVYNYNSSTQQWVVQKVPVQPQDIQTNDNFGSSVALDGNTLVVGADNKANGTANGAGAVYVFQQQNVGGVWKQVAEFLGQTAGEHLGTSVGVSGTEALAGAPGSDTAYFYSSNGTAWTSQQTQSAPVAAGGGSGFGGAVSIDGSTAVVGAPSANNEGAAYVYVLNNGTWTQQGGNLGGLQLPEPLSQGGLFGSAVAVSGGEIIVGAPDAAPVGSTAKGAAYVFKVDSNGIWSADGSALQDLLQLNNNDHFGSSVAIDGQQVLVGAYGTSKPGNPPQPNQGAAYSFSLTNGFWELDTTTGLVPGGAARRHGRLCRRPQRQQRRARRSAAERPHSARRHQYQRQRLRLHPQSFATDHRDGARAAGDAHPGSPDQRDRRHGRRRADSEPVLLRHAHGVRADQCQHGQQRHHQLRRPDGLWPAQLLREQQRRRHRHPQRELEHPGGAGGRVVRSAPFIRSDGPDKSECRD